MMMSPSQFHFVTTAALNDARILSGFCMSSSGRPSLVIVDDEPDVLRSLHDLFRREYRVVTFERAAEAIEAIEEVAPQVVMSDQRMPGMTGVEFLRRVRERWPTATRLLFTGYADLDAVIDAINEGNVFRYISKPWEPHELIALMRQAVEQNALVVERLRLIAELRQTNERLREADTVKAAFIEVASHELNTPVAVILGLSELWRMKLEPGAPPEQRDWVERIRRSGQRLAGIVKRMFELTRTGQLAEPLVLEPTDLAALIHGVIDDARPFLGSRRQRVELSVDPALGSAVIDAAKIRDALTNLLGNAIKFTADEGVIHVRGTRSGVDWVRLEVSDAGIGIPAAEIPHVFEPFFTGFDTLHHSSGEREYCKRGIGLGLSVARHFVEMHGGSIEVTSQPGSGTTFGLRLPRGPLNGGGEPAAGPLDRREPTSAS